MHCSSCEPLLDRYLEGTLAPRKLADIRGHIEQCASCRELLDEVKVVDALLFTTKVPELPQNFTFAVMAEAGTMAPVREPRHRALTFAGIYVAASWIAAILFVSVTGISPAALFNVLTGAGSQLSARYSGVMHAAPMPTPALAAFGFGVLAVDLFFAAAIAAIYFGVRPRLAAAFAAHRRPIQ